MNREATGIFKKGLVKLVRMLLESIIDELASMITSAIVIPHFFEVTPTLDTLVNGKVLERDQVLTNRRHPGMEIKLIIVSEYLKKKVIHEIF